VTAPEPLAGLAQAIGSFRLTLDPAAFQLRVLVWPLLFGLGMYLFLTSQPVGRPKSDLAERLRRLDVDERIRAELEHGARAGAKPFFASRTLETILRPVLDDVGRLLQAALGRFDLFGIAGPSSERELERKLRIARAGVEPTQFFGEKVAAGVIGAALFPVMEALGVRPFGPWPVWLWAAGGVAGFLGPDWQLEQRLAARRTAAVMELPVLLDMLTIAASAGLALEQAVTLVARESSGVIAQELQLVTREMALNRRSVAEALEGMAERNAIPELASFVDQLRAAHEQGIPLVQTLSTQAEALREQKRLRILEAGSKASVRMILPIAVFILPVLFVVLLVPAGVQMMRLGG
jgi:tight adherence protein C